MSCLKCGLVHKCTHAREVALNAFLNLRIFTDAIPLFELSASRCGAYTHKKKRIVKKGQLKLF